MSYFKNIKTLDELKAAYRRLVMQHHPTEAETPRP